MKRPKIIKIKKVRVNITLDEQLFIKSGIYIQNLSGFLNKCLENYINKQEQALPESHKDTLCKKESPFNGLSLEEIREIASVEWTK